MRSPAALLADGAPPARGRRAALAVIVPFSVGYYLSYLLRTVNAVIAPDLVRELGLDAAQLGLLTSTYFLAFALAQLPVGVALDRYGPRRVVATLLVVATVGLLLFATGNGFVRLAVGRGLIGLGVSACLMGAFKAFGAAFPASGQASLTGVVMSAGAVGALSASLPIEWALPWLGWRRILSVLAACSAAAAAVIALSGKAADGSEQRLVPVSAATVRAGQLRAVLTNRAFWRFGPQAALFTGGFMAVQSLWAIPWMMTVDGRSRGEAAALLMMLNVGMLTGQLSIVFGAAALARARIDRERLMVASLSLALLVEGTLLFGLAGGGAPWFALGLFSAAGAQVYGVTASYFAAEMSGRVSAAVNLFAFVGAFLIQWGLGVAVDGLSASMAGPAAAWRAAFAGLWVAQVAAVGWGAWSSLKARVKVESREH